MAEYLLRRPHATDIARLVVELRASDRAEIAVLGCDSQTVIEQSVRDSSLCWAALADGELVLIFGVATLGGAEDIGVPWMLGTPRVAEHGRALMRRAPTYIAKMLRAYPRLVNLVHAENATSVNWLRHIGFELEPAAPFGPNRAMFHRFEMRAHGADASR